MSQAVSESKFNQILAARKKSKAMRYALYFIVFLLVVFSVESTIIEDTDWERIGTIGSVFKAVARFLPPDFALFTQLLKPTIETFMIACLGTMLALILAIPVSWFAAHNITPYKPVTYPIGRAIMTLTRSVHEIVWGLLFVSAVGLGAFPGILAVSMRSIGFISKLTAEAIEDIDPGPLEAIKATGANQFQVILYGVIPQILPIYLGNAIFQWDINIRRATIMGLVGAGGMGWYLRRTVQQIESNRVAAILLSIILLVLISEVSSAWARNKVAGKTT